MSAPLPKPPDRADGDEAQNEREALVDEMVTAVLALSQLEHLSGLRDVPPPSSVAFLWVASRGVFGPIVSTAALLSSVLPGSLASFVLLAAAGCEQHSNGGGPVEAGAAGGADSGTIDAAPSARPPRSESSSPLWACHDRSPAHREETGTIDRAPVEAVRRIALDAGPALLDRLAQHTDVRVTRGPGDRIPTASKRGEPREEKTALTA